jgi:pimeloyl-ACP methyl ester carboxylesterase
MDCATRGKAHAATTLPPPQDEAAAAVTRRTLASLLFVLGLLATGSAVAQVDVPDEAPIGGVEITFSSADGVTLEGNLFAAKGTPKGAILFVHEPFRSSRDWAYMAEKMSRKGFTSLVFDLRGHGRSLMKGDEELDRELFGDEEYQAMSADVLAGLEALRAAKGVGDAPVHVAGADLGGSLGLLLADEDPSIHSVALLSPGLGYDGVSIVGAVRKLGKRPLLLVFSMEDGYARKSTEVLEKEAVGPIHVETYYGVGHGTKMLAREPQLEVLLPAWFLGTIINAEGRKLEDAGKPVAAERETEAIGVDAEEQRKKMEDQRKASAAANARGVGDEGDEPKRFPADDRKK